MDKPESEHGRATHQYERNKVLPAWCGWHAFRRGLATNLNRLGVDDSVGFSDSANPASQ
jgi:hypothetical protein